MTTLPRRETVTSEGRKQESRAEGHVQFGMRVFLIRCLKGSCFVVDASMRRVQLATASAHGLHVYVPHGEDAHQGVRQNVFV